MGDRERKRALFDEFGRIGKALASGRRIELLDVLANGERTVDGLAGEVGLSVANTSQHLQVLRQASLVSSRREGTSVHYRLAGPALATTRAKIGCRLPVDGSGSDLVMAAPSSSLSSCRSGHYPASIQVIK